MEHAPMFPFFELEDLLADPDGQFGAGLGDPIGIGVAYGIVWGLFWVLYAALGRNQQRNSGAAPARLALVSAILATAAVFPAILAYGLGWNAGEAFHQVEFLVFVNAILLARYQLPFRPPGHANLMRVETPEVLESADRIAREMRIRRPQLRQFPGDGTSAWAYSLMQPTVAVMEGVLHRLHPAERDAILAHEFAHIANRTLWVMVAMKVTAISVAALATMSLPPGLPLVFALLMWVGLLRISGRWLEIDCDRRAARVVGSRAVIRGLDKIHALRGISNRGWRALLFDAIASHPSRDVRLDELRRGAPEADQEASAGDIGGLRYHRLASWLATGIWIVALIAGWIFAERCPIAVGIVWFVVAIFPSALRWMIVAPARRQHARRLGRRFRLARIVLPLLAGVLGGGAYLMMHLRETGWTSSPATSILGITLPIGLLFGAIAALAAIPDDKVRNAIRGAVNSRDFQKALDLARKHPRQIRRDVISQHNVALAHLGLGHRDIAVEEFTRLWEMKRFGFSGMWLAAIHLNENAPEESLRVSDGLSQAWTNDPAPPFLRSRALRRLGRLDEADAAVIEAIGRFEQARGDLLALRAGIALDRGDTDRARDLLHEAEQASPGGAYGLLIAAEIAQKGDDSEAAAAAVTKAIEALRRIPLPMFQFELEQLESSRSPSAPDQEHPEATEITEFVRQE
jgi:Zn-dependent protease with chaperone function